MAWACVANAFFGRYEHAGPAAVFRRYTSGKFGIGDGGCGECASFSRFELHQPGVSEYCAAGVRSAELIAIGSDRQWQSISARGRLECNSARIATIFRDPCDPESRHHAIQLSATDRSEERRTTGGEC